MGFLGIVDAVKDAYGPNGDWNGTQGIYSVNGRKDSSTYGIGFGYNDPAVLGYSNWGGVALAPSDSGSLLIRDTYWGDSLLKGSVDSGDFSTWLGAQGTIPTNPAGIVAGDYAYEALAGGTTVGSGGFSNWLGTQGLPALGGGSGPVEGATVTAVPEPSSLILLGAALLVAVCVWLKSNNRFTDLLAKGLKGMRTVRVLLLASCMILGLAAIANADMVYFLRPVTGDPNDHNEGSYTISGDGITTPWSVSIASGSANKDVSFELYAGIFTPAQTKPYYDQAQENSVIYIQNSATGTLSWTADTANSKFNADPSIHWTGPNLGSQVGSNWGVSSYGGLASPPSSVIFAAVGSDGTNIVGNYPSSTLSLLNSAGDTWSATPPSAMVLSSGTWGLVKIADLAVNYGSPGSSASTSVQALPVQWGTTASPKSNQFIGMDGSAGTLPVATKYNFAQIEAAIANSPFASGVTISTGTTTATGYAGRADVSGLAPAMQAILTGGSTTIGGTLTNTPYQGTGTQDTLNSWNVSGVESGFGAPATGSNLAPSATGVSFSLPYTAPSGIFGPTTLTVNAAGTGASGAALTNTPVTTSINVIGLASVGAGGTYGPTFTSPSVTNLAGLQTQLSSTVGGLGASQAVILAGNMSPSGTVSMAWRSPSGPELAGAYGHPLFSDVVNLNGISSGTPYVLQMSYDPNQIPFATSYKNPGAAAAAAADGQIYLGYNAGTTAAPMWVNAVDGNTGNVASPIQNFQGSYAAFLAQNPSATPANSVGDWGVTINASGDGYTAWAVVNHDAEFAVVPEPGTLALLAAGFVALGVAYRRRKVAKA